MFGPLGESLMNELLFSFFSAGLLYESLTLWALVTLFSALCLYSASLNTGLWLGSGSLYYSFERMILELASQPSPGHFLQTPL